MYTLIIWDPDAVEPSYIHALVIDILSPKEIMKGKFILPYTPPAPPPGTGVHRYYTGIFEQTKPISSLKPMKRSRFNLREFVKRHGLRLIHSSMYTVRAP